MHPDDATGSASAESLLGAAIVVDREGAVVRVIADQAGLGSQIRLGEPFCDLPDPSSREKAEAFLTDLADHDMVADCEMTLCIDEDLRPYYFAGSTVDEGRLVIMAPSRTDASRIIDELTGMNSELLNRLRLAIKRQLRVPAGERERHALAVAARLTAGIYYLYEVTDGRTVWVSEQSGWSDPALGGSRGAPYEGRIHPADVAPFDDRIIRIQGAPDDEVVVTEARVLDAVDGSWHRVRIAESAYERDPEGLLLRVLGRVTLLPDTPEL